MGILQTISNLTGRAGLQVKKHSPEILLGAGVVTFAATVILACKATTKMEAVMDKYEDDLDNLAHPERIEEAAEEKGVEYTSDDLKKDKIIVYKDIAIDTAKTYAPVAGMMFLSLCCFLGSYKILSSRYIAVTAAYNLVSTAFDKYRSRVRDELGDTMDRHFRYGTEVSEIEVTTVNEKGKTKTEKEQVEVIDRAGVSEYAKFFDKSCPEWDENPMFNLKWLRANEQSANDILNVRGHIFLNEVYDMIGLPHTPEGAVVGWLKDGDGDSYVDFGLYDPNNQSARRLVNGEDNVILLDFNVDGVIFDKI